MGLGQERLDRLKDDLLKKISEIKKSSERKLCDIASLKAVIKKGKAFPELIDRALTLMVDAGILSYSSEKTYAAVSRFIPDYNLNPQDSQRRTLYFIDHNHCERYAKAIAGDKKGRNWKEIVSVRFCYD